MADSFVELTESTGPKVQMDENSISGSLVQAQVCVLVSSSGRSNSFVEINESSGKKIQYFQNSIIGSVVYALAVVRCNSNGVPI